MTSYRIYFIIAFFSVIGLLGYFLIWPTYQEVASVQVEIEGVQFDIEEGEEYYNNLRKISERLEQYREQMSIMDSALPEKFYPPHLYDFFQSTCSRRGLILSGLGHSIGSSGNSKVKEISVGLNVSGDYATLKEFLSYLQSSVRFFSIGQLGLTSEGEEPFSLNLNIKTYSY
jgi:Tfp pilus assembly protein PilO